jgi:hypothetical protein
MPDLSRVMRVLASGGNRGCVAIGHRLDSGVRDGNDPQQAAIAIVPAVPKLVETLRVQQLEIRRAACNAQQAVVRAAEMSKGELAALVFERLEHPL